MIKFNSNLCNRRSNYDWWLEKYGKEEADLRYKKHAENSALPGEKNGMFGKTFYQQWVKLYGKEIADEKLKDFKYKRSEWLKNHPEHLIKMIKNSFDSPYKKTNIEKKVEEYLIEKNINYKYNFILEKYQFDFFLKDYNIIIEVQGDYWHANPKYYSDTDINLRKLNRTQIYKIEQDILKKELIKNKYEIIYLWETDIKNKTYKETLWNLLKLKK